MGCAVAPGGGGVVDIIHAAGLWPDGSAWQDVASELEGLGRRPLALDLASRGDGVTAATLADQVRAGVTAVDETTLPVLVVGQSAAAPLAWMAADARPDRVGRVATTGGSPTAGGEVYNDSFPAVAGVVHLHDERRLGVPATSPPAQQGDLRRVLVHAQPPQPVCPGWLRFPFVASS